MYEVTKKNNILNTGKKRKAERTSNFIELHKKRKSIEHVGANVT